MMDLYIFVSVGMSCTNSRIIYQHHGRVQKHSVGRLEMNTQRYNEENRAVHVKVVSSTLVLAL